MKRRPGMAVTFTLGFGLAFVVWTWLTLATDILAGLDRIMPTAPAPLSTIGQVLSALSLVFWPGVVYAALVGIAIWAYKRRLRNLTMAIGLTIPIGWGLVGVLKNVFTRLRPPTAMPVLTTEGWSYPSSHLVSAMAAAIVVIATTTSTRQTRRTIMGWRIVSTLIVVLVGVVRLWMNAHYLTDIVGGVLLGGFSASLAHAAAGVHMLPEPATKPMSEGGKRKRCAVIVNPTKVIDWGAFRRHVEYECSERGWEPPQWLETTEADPGRAMAKSALKSKVDLILGAGGDGTIRVICSELAGTGVPFALLPAGTGNLLARNLGIPLDEGEALDVAFSGKRRTIDLVRVEIDDNTDPDHFAVMSGIGLDALIMQGTNTDLKKVVGSVAYVMSALQTINEPPFEVRVSVDDEEQFTRKAAIALVGNVGTLQAGVQLIPDAQFDDGLLDLLLVSPGKASDWPRITAQVLAGGRTDEIDRAQAKRVVFETESPTAFQLDGDAAGECRRLVAELVPGALEVMVPTD